MTFSDLHDSSIEMVKETVNLINRSKPDLLLFTGDLLNGESIDSKKEKN